MKPLRQTLAIVALAAGTSLAHAQELKERAFFAGHSFRVDRVALSMDGKLLASGGGDNRGAELKLWDVATGKEIAALAGHVNSLMALAFSPDGKQLASADINGRVIVWDVAERKQRAAFRHDGWVHAVAFSRDGKSLAAAERRDVALWDVAAGKRLVSFKRPVEAWSMAFSGDLQTLASPNYQEIDLWDVTAGKERRILSEQRGAVRCVAFNGDDTILAAASAVHVGEYRKFRYRGEIKIWDVATGKERAAFSEGIGDAYHLALSPDGRTLAWLGRDGIEAGFRRNPELKVLSTATGRMLLTAAGGNNEFLTTAFAADGRLFAVRTSKDYVLRLVEVMLPRP